MGIELPNFLIIGAAKSGTSSLYHYLKQHPEIFMSPHKEPNFFAFEGENVCFSGPGDDIDTNAFSVTSLKDYCAFFKKVTNEVAVGEASPLYLYSPKAPMRIKHYIPDVKLIAILRNPVQRAFSNYLHFARNNREPKPDFQSALKEETKRIQDNWQWFWHYTSVGFYAGQLKRYFANFHSKQIKIFLYEDLKNNPRAMLKDLFEYLTINPGFRPNLSIKYNVSGFPKNRLLQKLLTKPNPIKAIAKLIINDRMRIDIRAALMNKNIEKPQIDPDIKNKLIVLYKNDILQVQDIINRDLSDWLK